MDSFTILILSKENNKLNDWKKKKEEDMGEAKNSILKKKKRARKNFQDVWAHFWTKKRE